MIVFISDLHVGAKVPLLPVVALWSRGAPSLPAPMQMQLSAGAVEGFYEDLARLAHDAGAKQVTVVLLGDVFDFIQTRVWLCRADGRSPTWSRGDPDANEVMTVLQRIANDNGPLFAALAGPNELPCPAGRGEAPAIPLERVYIPGNHDRLCNKYAQVRQLVDQTLGLHRPDPTAPFPWSFQDGAHHVFARHGHVHDADNYGGTPAFTDQDHLRTPVGDLLTTEIASTLPDRVVAVLDKLKRPPSPTVVAELKRDLEAMFSVPGLGTIRWFVSRILQRWRGGKVLWASLVALGSLASRFARQCLQRRRWFGQSWCQDATWALRAMTPLPVGLLIAGGVVAQYEQTAAPAIVWSVVAAAVVAVLAMLWWPVIRRNPDQWLEDGARQEAPRLNRDQPDAVRCIVYGHTHNALQRLLTTGGQGEAVHYLNSGTWRQLIDEAADGSGFGSHKSLTYVVVYSDEEQAARRARGSVGQAFECWTGALRDDECF